MQTPLKTQKSKNKIYNIGGGPVCLSKPPDYLSPDITTQKLY